MIIETPNITDLRLFLNRKEADENIICSLADRKGTILYVNERFCGISGYTEAELVGSNHNLVNSGMHNAAFFKNMWLTIGNGNIWQGEIRNKTKSGSYYWVDTVIFPVYSPTQQSKLYFSVRTLINDKKAIAAERQNRIEELQTILFKISHDLRQPVTQLKGLSALLSSAENIKDTEIDELVQHISTSTQMLDNYTKALTRHIEQIAKKENEYFS